jgi:putative acetyltransferase
MDPITAITVRDEMPADRADVRELLASVYVTATQAEQVDALRAARQLPLSLVAIVDGVLVAHLGFSPVRVAAAPATVRGLLMEPLTVDAAVRGRSIGTTLTRRGLHSAMLSGYDFLLVRDSSPFFERFGFKPAANFGLIGTDPSEPLLALALRPQGLAGLGGRVEFAPALLAHA